MIKVTIIGLDDARQYVTDLPGKIQGLAKDQQVLKEIGTQLRGSAIRTINMSGYGYSPYKPLAQSTLRKRAAEKTGSKPLIRHGTLRNSLDYELDGGDLYLVSVDYLKYHQWTEDRTKARFPARPVWGVFDDDIDEISDIVLSRLEPEIITNKLRQGLI
jgi:phage gpG-like protein